IAESPAFLQLRGRDEAKRAAERLLAALDIAPTDAAALVDVPLDRLLAAQGRSFTGPELFTAFAPTPDGTVLPAPVPQALAQGAGADVALVLGTTRDDLYLFPALDGRAAALDADGLLAVARRHAGDAAPELVAAYHDARPDLLPGQLATSIAGDDGFWL